MIYSSIVCLSSIADEKHHCWPGEMKLEKLVSLGEAGVPGVKTDSSRVRVCDTPELSHQPFSGNMENQFPISTTSQTPRKVLRYSFFQRGKFKPTVHNFLHFESKNSLVKKQKSLKKIQKYTQSTKRMHLFCIISRWQPQIRTEQGKPTCQSGQAKMKKRSGHVVVIKNPNVLPQSNQAGEMSSPKKRKDGIPDDPKAISSQPSAFGGCFLSPASPCNVLSSPV